MAKLLDVVEGWSDELGPFTLLADDVAIDLTGLTVTLILTDANGETVAFAGSTRVDGDPTTGKVYYTPDEDDLSAALSPYGVHWQVSELAGASVYFPNTIRDTIVVNAQ